MLTIDSLRDARRASGFKYVTFLRGERPVGSSGYSAGRKDKYRAHKVTAAGDWYGPCRLTGIEAAADACVYLNGTGVVIPGPRLMTAPKLNPSARKRVTVTTSRKPPFPPALRAAIHKRAAGACESCGLRYAHPDAHHIDDKGDHSMRNGASLCKNCHGITYLGSPQQAEAINARLRAKRALDTPTAKEATK